MFRAIVDVLKEVFWIKPSRKAKRTPRQKAVRKSPPKSPVKKKIVKEIRNRPVKASLGRSALAVKTKKAASQKPAKSPGIDPSLV